MSLKRLLNPTSDDHNASHPPHRSQLGWHDYGVSVDTEPILQDQSWPQYVDELLGPQSKSEGFTQNFDGDDSNFSFVHLAQEQIEQWTAANMPSQMTSGSPESQLESEDERVCYGMIYRVSVKLKGNMSELDSKLRTGGDSPIGGWYVMNVMRSDEQHLIILPDGYVMGELNAQMEKALEAVANQQLRFEVFAPISAICETISRTTKEKDAVVRVNINVYGSRKLASKVGNELSTLKVYLQKPDYLGSGITYDNPHILRLPNMEASLNERIDQVGNEKKPEAEKPESFKKTISDVYSSLRRGHGLVGLEGDERLKTTLLQHQKEALDFMSQRENGPIPDEFLLWKTDEVEGQPCLRHVITNSICRFPRDETGGGILADEMGMGKTLSVLALVLRTLNDAHGWESRPSIGASISHGINANGKPLTKTRATLIIASSDLMINEWLQEMDRHFDFRANNILKTIKYHGQNRETEVAKLCDADLVITTYHTLASDFANRRDPLNDIEWYRLVLDEAHIIRRQSTGLYKTVSQLKAKSRWCLTGTPIQNRLEDIGSLFAFIRVNPFHSMATFRKYIAIPFDEGPQRRKLAIERFTRLLDSLCLRRTKDLLRLPDQHEEVRHIEFLPEEKEQYEQTKKMMFRAVKNQVGVFDHKSTLGMFQVQLQLRILCNHGTYQQPFSWNRRKLHLLDEREAMEMTLGSDGEVTCSVCKQTMPMCGAGSTYKRYTEHCRHVLCFECVEESMSSTQKSIDMSQDSLSASCPLCALIRESMTGTVPSQSQNSTHSEELYSYFRKYGRSSKMEVLLRDIQSDLWSTKSIVFSCWTHTLDLIQIYLNGAAIHFQRIDGECPTAKRQKILEDFAKNPNLRVLIMTTGTGAVGLNLATANRVFIIEPQWNPTVEKQAIARALRLGQEKAVQVTRYVVNKTVEQEMRTLQDRKLEIAEIAWE